MTDLKSGNCHYATGSGGIDPNETKLWEAHSALDERTLRLTLHNQLELSLAQPSGAAFRDRDGIAEAGAAFALCRPDLGFENERHAGLQLNLREPLQVFVSQQHRPVVAQAARVHHPVIPNIFPFAHFPTQSTF